MQTIEFNPVVALFDKYVNNRFAGDIEERSYMEALISVQMEMLKQIGADQEKVKWLLKCLADRHLKANLEIEYAKQYTAKRRTMH